MGKAPKKAARGSRKPSNRASRRVKPSDGVGSDRTGKVVSSKASEQIQRKLEEASQWDVLILGDHPSAYLAGALLREDGRLRVIHVRRSIAAGDRLSLINPALFSLHKSLESVRRPLGLHPLRQVRFLGDQPEFSSTVCLGLPGPASVRLLQVRDLFREQAEQAGVLLVDDPGASLQGVDEQGVEWCVRGCVVRARGLLLSEWPEASRRSILNLPQSWEPGVVNRLSSLMVQAGENRGEASHLLTLALDLHDVQCWGWLIPHAHGWQVMVQQPLETVQQVSPVELLERWIDRLVRHGVVASRAQFPSLESLDQVDLPLAGGLSGESVANRSLLIGPAGGFVSLAGEEIYPGCVSAVHAVEVMRKALKEKHLQDALQAFRQRWGAVLGEYLRGLQPNVRFLLPLVYRNKNMSLRLAESILLGRNVIH